MRKLTWSVLGLLVFGFLLSTAAPAADLTQPLPVDPQLILGRLDNGLTYYVRANQRPEKHAVLYLMVDAGSILEDDDQRGLAHFVEHMAFNGSRHFKGRELVSFFQSLGMQVGAHVNAATEFDQTVYQLFVPTGDAAVLGQAFQVLEDWAHGLSFDPSEIEKERGVLLGELRSSRGAGTRIRDRQLPTLFKDSRYARRLPEGRKDVVENASADDLRRFYRDWYRPDLMAVVAVGDFDPRQVEALIRKRFSSLARPASPRHREVHGIPDSDATLVSVETDPEATLTQATVFFKHERSPLRSVGDYRGLVMEDLFVALLNARLGELLLRPSPPFVAAGAEHGQLTRTTDYGAISLQAKEGEVRQGLEALISEVERVERHGFTASELERVQCQRMKAAQATHEERDKIDSFHFAGRYLGHFAGRGSLHSPEHENRLAGELIPGIRVDEVNRLASRWRGGKNRAVLVVAPAAGATTLPSQQALLDVLARVEGKPLEPYLDQTSDRPLLAQKPSGSKIVSEREIAALGVTEWTLGNGVKVVLKPTTFQNDEILFTAFSPGGLSLVPAPSSGSAAVAVELVGQSGLGAFTRNELAKKLACNVFGVAPYVDLLSEGVQGAASAAEVETLFQVIHLMLTSPRAEPHALETIRQRYSELIRHWSPEEELGQLINEVMTQGDPRFRRPSELDVAKLSLEKALAFYRDRFSDLGDLTFIMVGNLPFDRLRPLAETYLGGLPSRGRQETFKDPGVHPPRGVVKRELRKGLAERSSVQLRLTGPFRWTPEEELMLTTIGIVLQQRLEKRLREQLGATYGVGVDADCFGPACARIADSEYQIIVGFDCQPSRAEELLQEVFREIEKLLSADLAAGEMASVKQQYKTILELGLQQNGGWLEALKEYYMVGEHALDLPRLERAIDGLTPAAIRGAAQKYLATTNQAQFVLYPERGGR